MLYHQDDFRADYRKMSEKLRDFRLPVWEEFPDLELYMDQMIVLLNRYLTFDEELAKVLTRMHEDDLLIINADHGCDPTFKGTDHTREYIPVLMYHKKMKQGVNMGTLNTFADIGATIADNYGVNGLPIGTSLKKSLR